MKKLALLVLMVLVVAVPAYAQLGDTDNSSFVIQNLGQNQATVTVTFYDEGGSAFTPDPILTGKPNPFTLAPGAKQDVYMPSVLGLADGRYSVVIESTEPVGVVANLVGQSAGGAPFYNGSYSGFNQGAMTIYFPSTQHQFYGWNSLMSIQNTTANPINVTVNFLDQNGNAAAAPKAYAAVPAFSSVHLDLETEGAGLGLPAGLNGSATVECSGACVGTDNQTAGGGLTQSYNAFLAGGRKLFAPALYRAFYTWDGSLKVQNIGAGDTTITVQYTIDGGGSCNPPAEVIGPGAALYHYLPDVAVWGGCPDATDKIIGAIITSTTEDVVGVVNAANPANQAQTYGAFSEADGALTVGAPVIMNKYFDWDTAFACQNLDDTNPANVTYVYSGLGCPGGGCAFTLQPGQATSVHQPSDVGLAGNTGLFAATITSVGAPIACIVNETNVPGQVGGTGDWSMSYNAFGQ